MPIRGVERERKNFDWSDAKVGSRTWLEILISVVLPKWYPWTDHFYLTSLSLNSREINLLSLPSALSLSLSVVVCAHFPSDARMRERNFWRDVKRRMKRPQSQWIIVNSLIVVQRDFRSIRDRCVDRIVSCPAWRELIFTADFKGDEDFESA